MVRVKLLILYVSILAILSGFSLESMMNARIIQYDSMWQNL